MNRWFNVAGPCRPDIHYMLPPTDRIPEVMRLIHQQSYFVLHAPRQTGKTTAMLTLAQELTSSGQWTAVLLSVEVGSALPPDDIQFVLDLGLVRMDATHGLVIANPIYAAVIPRTWYTTSTAENAEVRRG
ncbi:hypothetical protein OSCT_2181 [Oscillochloris trichoides DG-6]|uniref:Uncharacterized protein n=1 Tax=Oscillochloris trichoides DG-6 TaxID=765420 RepID=E1IFT0_9CHLR|nr:hypothetical protein [Oscillochloris trichoides]EFO79971.1 hypothetical protein OSCT_2181 [Oscillochloris trichoides DG-6]